MSYIGNGPQSETVLRLEARKSFALGLEIRDQSGRVLDITGASFRIVMKALPLRMTDTTDSDNLITNSIATIVDPTGGVARFSLQALDLNRVPGEYPFVIVMLSGGYSSVIVGGTIDVQQNTEFASVASTYLGTNPPVTLQLNMAGSKTLAVFTGATLAPGTTSYTLADKAKLDAIQAYAQANVHADWSAAPSDPSSIFNKPLLGTAAFESIESIGVPRDGAPGMVLMKNGVGNNAYSWAVPPVGPGPGNLTAVGIGAGYVPTANGANSWGWSLPAADLVQSVAGRTGAVVVTLGDAADTAGRLAMLPAERVKLTGLTATPAYSSLTGTPTLGSVASHAFGEFLLPLGVAAADVVSGVLSNARVPTLAGLRGYSQGTGAPSGGVDGDIYLQYT